MNIFFNKIPYTKSSYSLENKQAGMEERKVVLDILTVCLPALKGKRSGYEIGFTQSKIRAEKYFMLLFLFFCVKIRDAVTAVGRLLLS